VAAPGGSTSRSGVTPITATLQISIHQWCVQFQEPKLKKGAVNAKTNVAPTVRQHLGRRAGVFERNGCGPVCHRRLRARAISICNPMSHTSSSSTASRARRRVLVHPGSRQDSFLWEKLAASTEGMISRPRLTDAERRCAGRLRARSDPALDQFGAPNTGVVNGTGRCSAAVYLRPSRRRHSPQRRRQAPAYSSTRRRGRPTCQQQRPQR
jgi:hypothetical protein